ncbi:hypothetical protein KC644_02905 [Candidatus Berkelbacteria bacterium]|nr:hypothetical protein [Candidatus Berkelbacteria bacterium]
MGKNVLIATGFIVITILIFGYWLFSSQPSQAEIDNLRQPQAPLPVVNFNNLEDSNFTDKQIFGDIPVNLDNAGLGKEDPFVSF